MTSGNAPHSAVAPSGDAQTRSEPAGQGDAPQVAGYRVVRRLGQGGMGIVYEAYDESLQRPVALKVLRPAGRATAEAARRFRREVVITGRLQHPGIVPVYAAADARGQPCYVMRLIQGVTLADAVRQVQAAAPSESGWTLRQLLHAFVSVCRTLAYAHAQGVIHRDLKPANIMLGPFGETLVLDWGLAKEFGAQQTEGARPPPAATCAASAGPDLLLAETRVFHAGPQETPVARSDQEPDSGLTADGTAMGTPAYMSPEQARGDVEGLGPPADVFSLGGTLFTILTGVPPHEGSLLEVLTIARAGALLRPRAIRSDIPRALEAIVQRAAAAAPKQRYAGALELADDVERWLADEPVRAYREPWLGRAARWGRRHRTLVRSGVALFATILVALTLGGVAVSLERSRTAQVELEAQLNRRAAAEIATMLDELFRSADPVGLEGFGFRQGAQRAADVTARQLLDAGARQVAARLDRQPDVQAALFATMGNTYRALGEFESAEKFLSQSLEQRRRALGDDHADVATSRFLLGMLRQDTGKYDEAERLYRQALDVTRKQRGADDLLVARIEFQLAWLLTQQPLAAEVNRNRMAEAEELVRDVVAIRRAKLDPHHRELGLALAALAGVCLSRGAEAEAKPVLLEAFAILDRPENSGGIGSAMAHFIAGEGLRQLRRFADAVQSHRKVVDIVRKQLGEEHPLFAGVLANLAGTQRQAGDMEGAERSIRQVLTIARKSPLRANPMIVDMFIQVADALRGRGDLSEAEGLYREARTFGVEGGPPCAHLVERATQRLAEQARGTQPDDP